MTCTPAAAEASWWGRLAPLSRPSLLLLCLPAALPHSLAPPCQSGRCRQAARRLQPSAPAPRPSARTCRRRARPHRLPRPEITRRRWSQVDGGGGQGRHHLQLLARRKSPYLVRSVVGAERLLRWDGEASSAKGRPRGPEARGDEEEDVRRGDDEAGRDVHEQVKE